MREEGRQTSVNQGLTFIFQKAEWIKVCALVLQGEGGFCWGVVCGVNDKCCAVPGPQPVHLML